MINKKMVMVGLTAALSMTAISALAGSLTMKSQNEPNAITLMCGTSKSSEANTNLPVPANGQRGPLPYALISFMFGSSLTCDFYNGSVSPANDIGTAVFSISSDLSTATISTFQNLAPNKFDVSISSGSHGNLPVNVPAKNITVLLSGK
ncbi:MAG: hypothetical protein NTZ67_05060 [Gammaproteobacteria bacterium]|nr:hypothetical protein [Gammaproteobacteria bacterium]